MAPSSSVRSLLLSAGILSAALLFTLSLPSVASFLLRNTPLLYDSLLSWLTPPYLYLVINGIIVSIAASSRFHPGSGGPVVSSTDDPSNKSLPDPRGSPPLIRTGEGLSPAAANPAINTEDNDDEEFVISRSDQSLTRKESIDIPTAEIAVEKTLVSARFSAYRKSVKASPEGNRLLLGVSKPKRNETLESTWKVITDGRPMPLARHLKKSETMEPTRGDAVMEAATPVKKSETFKERRWSPSPSAPPASSSASGGGNLRKEASLSQDELNRRVEAFIKKFNEEMRLQRQESFNHYMEMVNRGVH